MQPFILKPYLIRNKIYLTFLVLLLCLLCVLPNTSWAKNDPYERAYYYFLLSQIFTENLEEVEKNLKKTIEIEKKSLFLKKMLLSLYIQTQNYKSAEKLGENLYQKDPSDRELIFLLSKLYLQQNRPNKAISYLERYLEINPKDNELLSFLISIYLQQKDWDQALIKLNQLQKYHPEASVIWLFKARIYREKKDLESAKHSYLKAVELSPDNRSLLMETLNFLESISAFYEIERILQNYLLKNPEDKEFLKILLGFYLEQKEWDKSEKLLEEYLLRQKDQPELLFFLGLTLEYKGKEEEALKVYQRIPLDSPWVLEAKKRSFEILKKRDIHSAEALLRELKKQNISEKSLLLFMSHAYEDLDLCEDGINIAKEALIKFPEDPELTLALASNYACLEEYEKVLEVVEPLLKKFPEDAYILNFVGYSLVELERDLFRAEQLLLKANELKPNDPYIEDSLGWLYFKKGEIDKALYYLEKAYHNAKTDEPVVWEHLGDVYVKKGELKKACELYKKAYQKTLHKREKMRLMEKLKKCP